MVMMAVMTIKDDDDADVDNDDEHHNDAKLIFTYTIIMYNYVSRVVIQTNAVPPGQDSNRYEEEKKEHTQPWMFFSS